MSMKTASPETKRRVGLLRAQITNKIKKEKSEWNIKNAPFAELKETEKRKRILKEQDNKCQICKNDSWNEKSIPLELDHIDGNRKNNSRDNLRFVCPNCHAQTTTYKIGNNKNPGNKSYSDEEIIVALQNNTSGYTAMKSLGMNPHGGNYTRVRKIIKKYALQLSYSV